MPAIRRRYHYGNLILSPEHKSTDSALCGNTIDIFNGSGEIKRIEFAGFCSLHDYDNFSIFTNIIGYHNGDFPFFGGWVDYPLDTLSLGIVRRDMAFVAINNKRLCTVNYQIKPPINNANKNVFTLPTNRR